VIAYLSGFDLTGLTVITIGTVLTVHLARRRKVSFDFRKLQATVEDVQTTGIEVARAVNNVPPGAPTLLERVIVTEANTVMHAEQLNEVRRIADTARAETRELRNLVVKALERRP